MLMTQSVGNLSVNEQSSLLFRTYISRQPLNLKHDDKQQIKQHVSEVTFTPIIMIVVKK